VKGEREKEVNLAIPVEACGGRGEEEGEEE